MGNESDRGIGSSSITTRLTLLFAGSTFSVLVLSGAVLYWSLARSLRSEDARILRENASVLVETLRRYGDRPSTLRDEIIVEPSTRRLEPFYARLLETEARDTGEHDIIETPGMADLLPVGRFPPATASDPVSWRSPGGHTFLLFTRDVSGSPPRRIQVALDVTHDAVLLARYRWVLLAVLLMATIAASAVGRRIARRGLRPIDRITKTMREITATHLDRRTGGAAAWPEELAALAGVFDEMLDRLEESFSRLSRFSADLAHELRTPLSNLRSEAEIALARARAPAEYQSVLESNLEEYGRLTELVDRLLFLARAEAGASSLELRDFEADEQVRDVLELYAAVAEEKGVEIRCEGSAPVAADPTLFRRALANLVSNALDHTPAGGRVSVAIEHRSDGVGVIVEDSGCGIPVEHLSRVKDRFYRVDPARSAGGGAGLGLSLVQTIMDLHDGFLHLTSSPGQGTTATLTFPKSTAVAAGRPGS